MSDLVVVKETQRYLRGRGSVDEMTALYLEGIAAGGNPPHTVAADEPDALETALRDLQPGDVGGHDVHRNRPREPGAGRGAGRQGALIQESM